MSRDLTDDKSTLVQVMAWCLQATSHYLNQCWPRSMSPYGVTMSMTQRVKKISCLLVCVGRGGAVCLLGGALLIGMILYFIINLWNCSVTIHYLNQCSLLYVFSFYGKKYEISTSGLLNLLSQANYCKISNIRCTKSQNLNDSRLILHLSLPNLLKPGVK